jgi:hypothetical protein
MRIDAPSSAVRAGGYPRHGRRGQPKFPEHRGVNDYHVPDVDQRVLVSCERRILRFAHPTPLELVLRYVACRA